MVPHSWEMSSSVPASLMPPRITLVPQQAHTVFAPCSPQRSASWLVPWATAVMSTPLPAESDSITGRSTGQIVVTSSRPSHSGGSSRPAGAVLPASPACQCTQEVNARNSGATGESSSPLAIRYSVPFPAMNPARSKPSPRGGVTAPARPGMTAHDSDKSMVSRTDPAVLFSASIRRTTASSSSAPGWPARTRRAFSWPSSCTHRYTSVMV